MKLSDPVCSQVLIPMPGKILARVIPRSRLPVSAAMCLMLLLSTLVGCAQRRAPDVDPDLARATLTEVLETWKRGGTISELRQRTPEIVVQEALWSQGRQLEHYELLGEGREEDANLFCEVELTLVDAAGDPPQKKTVTYVVGTAPVLTVFRAIL